MTGQLGTTIGTSALVAEWATGTIMRVGLQLEPATAATAVTPFLTGLEQPVAVAIGPDGTVFVGDWGTGTVYRIGTV